MPSRSTKLARGILYLVAAGLAIVIVFRPNIRILPPSFSQFNREVLFYRESVEGTLSVGQDKEIAAAPDIPMLTTVR